MTNRLAEVRSINSRYMNATLPVGIAFRSGIAVITNERHMVEALRLDGVSVRVDDTYLDQLPRWLNDCGPFKPPKAKLDLPESYKIRKKKDGPWELLHHNKTPEQEYPTPAEEPELVPILGWTPPTDGGQ